MGNPKKENTAKKKDIQFVKKALNFEGNKRTKLRGPEG